MEVRETSWVDVVSVPKRVADAPEVAVVLDAAEEPAVVDAAEAEAGVEVPTEDTGGAVSTGILVSSIAD